MEETLGGVVTRVVFQNEQNGYAVLQVETDEQLLTAVGPLSHVQEGEEVVLTGQFEQNQNYGSQFRVTEAEVRLPQEEASIFRYLAGGAVPGIGPAIAKKLVQRFGLRTLELLASKPEELTAVGGFGIAKARAASAAFRSLFGAREVMEYFGRFGLSAVAAMSLYRAYGEGVLSAFEQNPYILTGPPLHLHFSLADQIAQQMQVDHEDFTRLAAGLTHILRHNTENGHTCLPKEKLLATAAQFLKAGPRQCEQALEEAVERGLLVLFTANKKEMAALPGLAAAEHRIALTLLSILKQPVPKIGQNNGHTNYVKFINLSDKQALALEMASENGCFILTGGPGTGKTTTLQAMLQRFESEAQIVYLCAPTGRAAKRIEELTGREAKTIHRLLEVPYGAGKGELVFTHGKDNPLRCDVVIVDEVSMVDVALFDALLAALRPGTRLILVGDAAQLPSVGPGNILGDLLRSGQVPFVELTEVFRQGQQSQIVLNAHRILQGQLPQTGDQNGDYFFISSAKDSAKETIADLVQRRLPEAYGFAQNDIQVLCPSRMGACGTAALNPLLQQQLNPKMPGKPEVLFRGQQLRRDDRVMQVRNNYDIAFEKADGTQGAGAYNGDIGIVSDIQDRGGRIAVAMEDRSYFYNAEELSDLEIAYAVTVHKSQGSEFPCVVLALADVPPKLRYRNLLYTAITRARQLLVVVGELDVLEEMVQNDRKTLRYTALASLLQEGDAWL